MTFGATVLLATVAGFTIFLGLPVGRVRLVGTRLRVSFAMFSVGILVFLLVDVLKQGFDMTEAAVTAVHAGTGSFGRAVVDALLLVGGFTIGSAGLAFLERRLLPARGRPSAPIAGGSGAALTVAQHRRLAGRVDTAAPHALRTGLIVAAAIGVHNFAEGLAIGVSAQAGEIGLATVLIVGFALHNATEGFGIVGPLGDVRPSWAWLGLAGLVGGGPTFLGAIVGYHASSESLALLFYALAGGAILYVIGQIWHGMRRFGHGQLAMLLLAAGFAAGILTDLVVAYGGG